mmetsp:Transcript_12204/g.33321  ORF Transcript_12204/g.33321 Transcript_12204/m.33321 type:complete len:236 (-) Transcript_12204:781-1488(-)
MRLMATNKVAFVCAHEAPPQTSPSSTALWSSARLHTQISGAWSCTVAKVDGMLVFSEWPLSAGGRSSPATLSASSSDSPNLSSGGCVLEYPSSTSKGNISSSLDLTSCLSSASSSIASICACEKNGMDGCRSTSPSRSSPSSRGCSGCRAASPAESVIGAQRRKPIKNPGTCCPFDDGLDEKAPRRSTTKRSTSKGGAQGLWKVIGKEITGILRDPREAASVVTDRNLRRSRSGT